MKKTYYVVCFYKQKHCHYVTKQGATRNLYNALRWRYKICAKIYMWALNHIQKNGPVYRIRKFEF